MHNWWVCLCQRQPIIILLSNLCTFTYQCNNLSVNIAARLNTLDSRCKKRYLNWYQFVLSAHIKKNTAKWCFSFLHTKNIFICDEFKAWYTSQFIDVHISIDLSDKTSFSQYSTNLFPYSVQKWAEEPSTPPHYRKYFEDRYVLRISSK